jgi:hypothetical protein
VADPEEPQVFNLRLGAVKQRAQPSPMAKGFNRSAVPRAMDITAVRQIG